jgi:hypothetical protein
MNGVRSAASVLLHGFAVTLNKLIARLALATEYVNGFSLALCQFSQTFLLLFYDIGTGNLLGSPVVNFLNLSSIGQKSHPRRHILDSTRNVERNYGTDSFYSGRRTMSNLPRGYSPTLPSQEHTRAAFKPRLYVSLSMRILWPPIFQSSMGIAV